MKRLITTLILPLLLLTACKSTEKFDPSDYTFPPEDVREMEWVLDEAGLDGYKAEDARMTTDKVPGRHRHNAAHERRLQYGRNGQYAAFRRRGAAVRHQLRL